MTGAVLGATAPSEGDLACTERAECIGVGAAVVGAFGGLVGLGVGALIKTERWEEVPLDQLRLSPVPQRDGRLGIGLALKF